MKLKIMGRLSILLCFTLFISLYPISVQAKTVTSNESGTHEGYDYEFWKDTYTGNQDSAMKFKEGEVGFSCEWSNIHNILFKYGYRYDMTLTHHEIGNVSVNYECSYQSETAENGYTITGVYGWTAKPHGERYYVEYYIVESCQNWKPSDNLKLKDTIVVDGGEYDIYEEYIYYHHHMDDVKRYWSVRREPRTSGTVSVSQHFRAWETLDKDLGKLYEIAFLVEGYRNIGSAELTKFSINIDKSDQPNTLLGDVNEDGYINSLDYAVLRQYLLGKIQTISQNADINKDGNVDSLDFALLRMHLVGKIHLGVTTTTS